MFILFIWEHPQRVHYQKYKGDLIKIRRLGEWIKPTRPGCTMCFRRTLMKNYQSLWFREYPHDCLLWGLAVLQGKAYIYNRETIEFRRHDSNASSRGGYDVNYRIRGIENEIRIINQADNYFELHDLKLHSFLRIQKEFMKKKRLFNKYEVDFVGYDGSVFTLLWADTFLDDRFILCSKKQT